MKDTCQVYHQGRRKPLTGLFFRIYEGFLKDWRSLGDSNPCFRRERATSWAARRREPGQGLRDSLDPPGTQARRRNGDRLAAGGMAFHPGNSLVAHDLVRKPVPTFRDHALGLRFKPQAAERLERIGVEGTELDEAANLD